MIKSSIAEIFQLMYLAKFLKCIIYTYFGFLLSGTTMIEWSIEKATTIDRSRMHFACYNFDN